MLVTNREFITQIQEMARAGDSVISILEFLVQALDANKDARFTVIVYFIQAFDLKIRDAKQIGAWEFFRGGTQDGETIEQRIAPLLNREL